MYFASHAPITCSYSFRTVRPRIPLRLPRMPFLLRNIWTGAMLLFTFLTLATFVVTRVWQAIIIVSLVGICWAVACWAPFAIIMEFLKEQERDSALPPEEEARERVAHVPCGSRAAATNTTEGERAPLLRRRHPFGERDADAEPPMEAASGGTILGIHNLAIVMPQFVVSVPYSH